MVNIYESLYQDNAITTNGRTKLFIKSVEDDYSIGNYDYGVAFTTEENGTQFIVDDWLIPQLDKVQFVNGTLSVKDGEELIPPVKTEKELKREALLRQIAELDAEEESEDTEEHTDDVFKEYDELINDDFRQEPTE